MCQKRATLNCLLCAKQICIEARDIRPNPIALPCVAARFVESCNNVRQINLRPKSLFLDAQTVFQTIPLLACLAATDG